jgi:hypothetical protein
MPKKVRKFKREQAGLLNKPSIPFWYLHIFFTRARVVCAYPSHYHIQQTHYIKPLPRLHVYLPPLHFKQKLPDRHNCDEHVTLLNPLILAARYNHPGLQSQLNHCLGQGCQFALSGLFIDLRFTDLNYFIDLMLFACY